MVSQSETILGKNLIYDWYSYLQDFPGSFVYGVINRFDIKKEDKVFDPFVGHGTTPLTCKLFNINSNGFDVNPFCVFASKVKTNWDLDINKIIENKNDILNNIYPRMDSYIDNDFKKVDDYFKNVELIPPEMPGLEKWISPKVVDKILKIKYLIENIVNDKDIKNFFLFGLASIIRDVSNITLSLNVSMRKTRKTDEPVFEIFSEKINKMMNDIKEVKKLNINNVINLEVNDSKNSKIPYFDYMITSPPYPNDIDYVNQTRMELFFLDLIKNIDEYRQLKKDMITSDATYYVWSKENTKYIEYDEEIMKLIEKLRKSYEGKNWGWDYATMSSEYFGDMYLFFDNLYNQMEKGSKGVLVVGDSALNKILVPADLFTEKIAKKIGFKTDIEFYRERKASSHSINLKESLIFIEK